LVFIIISSHHVKAITLNCEFKMLNTYLGTHYACVADNLRTTLTDRERTAINGTHESGKSHNDVLKFYVKKQNCPFLPLNVGGFFKNLEIYYVMNSHVKHIMTGDLDGLDKLTAFDVSHNPVEQLGHDFFKDHPTIRKISFFDCHLKIIDPEALTPLKNLETAAFQYNVCIDYQFTRRSGDSMSGLKNRISKCHTNTYGDQIYNQLDGSTPNQTTPMTFTQRNAYLIISFFVLVTVALSVVLVKIVRTKFDNDWKELKNAII
jgi:hypothetical protein